MEEFQILKLSFISKVQNKYFKFLYNKVKIIKQINYIDYIMKKSNYSGEVVVAAGGHFFVTEGAIISWKKR